MQIGSDVADYDAGWNAAVAVLAACVRPAAHGPRPAHRRVGAGVAARAQPHPPEPVQQRRRHAPPRRESVRLLRDDRVPRRVGAARRTDARPVGRARGVARRRRARRSAHRDRGRARRRTSRPLPMRSLSWCKARDKADVVRILTPLGCPIGAYALPSDLLSSAQLEHRGFFRDVDDGRDGTLRVPGPPYRFSATPAEVRPAPRLGSSDGFRDARGRPSRRRAGPRARGRAGARLHVGRRRPVRDAACSRSSARRS